MASPKETIEGQIADIVLADANFASLKMLTIGLLWRVPVDFFPLCEVLIANEQDADQRTGQVIRQYLGAIRFNVIVSDTPTATANARKVTVPSYLQVTDFVNAAVQLFNQQANFDLGGLTGSDPVDWAVRRFMIETSVEYGIESRTGREDNYENYGTVPFICETQEAKV